MGYQLTLYFRNLFKDHSKRLLQVYEPYFPPFKKKKKIEKEKICLNAFPFIENLNDN